MNKVLEFQHVSLTWPDFTLKDISFSLDRGYIMGLVGYNGAGKTTLFRLMENKYKKYGGTILIDGYDCRTQEAKVKDITAFISDEQQFFFEESALTNAKILSPYYSTWDMLLFQKHLDQFEISTKTKMKDLSRGSFLKFQLAFAIAHHPLLYVMDEPTAGLDPVFRYDFLRILQKIVAEENASILLSTHNTSDLDKIADYITMLDDGCILFTKDIETLSDEVQNCNDERRRFHVSSLFKKGRWN
jgi:ABC-2 type transport system ATP-binding protein